MEWYRVLNFVMQAVYLPVHLFFIVRLIVKRQPTPIWRWFIGVVICLWILVSGRFFESVGYIFYHNNSFYQFAVYYQLVGTAFVTPIYLIWNLYIAGCDRAADSGLLKTFLIVTATTVSTIICTNNFHHGFYEKLVMGEQVVHGPIFTLLVMIIYGILVVGWVVSVVHIVRKEKSKIKRLIVFSLYPILPGAAGLIRAITGVDEVDYTPIIMTVSIVCLYLIVFRYRFFDIVSQSVENALGQTQSALFAYEKATGRIVYRNRACEKYESFLASIIDKIGESPEGFEDKLDRRTVRVSVTTADDDDKVLVTVTDISTLAEERFTLEHEIEEQNMFVSQLEDKKKNIQAYLDSLYEIPHLKEKQEKLLSIQKEIIDAFASIEDNLEKAADLGEKAEECLRENIGITQTTIASVRAAVASLRETGGVT